MTEKVSRFGGNAGSTLPTWVGLRPKGESGASGAQTVPGRLAENTAKSLQGEIDTLRAERTAGMVVVRFDPKRVRATEFINRDERAFLDTDPQFIELKESMREHQQEQPGRVRLVTGDANFDAEVVSGHRRHRATLLLDGEVEGGFPFFALVDAKAADSRDLVLKMYRENEQRVDLSPYEKGCMFGQWIDAKLYETQREIAAVVGLHEATIAKYLAVSSLPEIVLAAFGDVRVISVRWGGSLSQALKDNEPAVLKAAEKLAQKQPLPPPDEVYKTLLAAAADKKRPTRATHREESVRIGGRVPLKVGVGSNRIVLKLFHVEAALQKELREELKDWAEDWLRKRLDKA